MKPKIIQSKFLAYWLLGVNAIVLYPFVFIYDKTDKVMLNHELIHIKQIKEDGIIKFYFKYLWDWVRMGFKYRKIPYEVEAYNNQDNLNYIK